VVMRSCDMRDARSRMCSDDACERRSGRCTLMAATWCFCRVLLATGSVGPGSRFMRGWRGEKCREMIG